MTRKLPEVVFHYTSHRAFMSILNTRQLWAHDSQLSNDRRETDYALGLLSRATEDLSDEPGYDTVVKPAYEALRDPFDPFALRSLGGYLVICSFSEEPNLLSQWRAYAPANGYSVGFNTSKLCGWFQRAGFSFGKVEYSFNAALAFFRRKIRQHIKKYSQADNTLETLVEGFEDLLLSAAPFVKHPSFEEEREWRAFKYTRHNHDLQFYAGQRSITPYIPIKISESDLVECLDEILVGPSDDQHTLADWTSDWLRNLGYEVRRIPQGSGVRVYVSGSPYRVNK